MQRKKILRVKEEVYDNVGSFLPKSEIDYTVDALSYIRMNRWDLVNNLILENKVTMATTDQNGKTLQQYQDEHHLQSAFECAKKSQWATVYDAIDRGLVPANAKDQTGSNFLDYGIEDNQATIEFIKRGVPILFDVTQMAFIDAKQNQWDMVKFYLSVRLLKANAIYNGKSLLDCAREHKNGAIDKWLTGLDAVSAQDEILISHPQYTPWTDQVVAMPFMTSNNSLVPEGMQRSIHKPK